MNALENPFVYDDHHQIVENRSLAGPINWHALVFQQASRPVLNLSFAVDRRLWGREPFGFHVTNVALHMLNVGLLFGFVMWSARGSSNLRPVDFAQGRPGFVAFCAAILLAVHPMMTQAVGYISGRSEVLSATGFLIALTAAARWLHGCSGAWLAVMSVAWLLALGVKETALMFPAVVLAYGLLLVSGDRAARKRVWQLSGVLIGVALSAAAVRLVILGVGDATALTPRLDLVLLQLDVLRRYVWMLLEPGAQAVFHAIPPVSGPGDPRVVMGAAVLTLMVAGVWGLRHVQPLASLGLAWFLLLLLPSLALVSLDRAEPMAEHRVYLAAAGLFAAFGTGIDRLLARLSARRPAFAWVIRVALALAVVSLAGRTVLRNVTWRSPVALWQEASAYAPDHWLPYIPLGEALHAEGRHAEAAQAFDTALRLKPDQHDAIGKMGVCLAESGRLDEARAAFERLERIDPNSAEVPYGLGLVALAGGDLDRARAHWGSILSADPLNVPARRSLAGLEEIYGGNPAAALHYCEEIRQLAPDTPGNDDCIARNQRRLSGR